LILLNLRSGVTSGIHSVGKLGGLSISRIESEIGPSAVLARGNEVTDPELQRPEFTTSIRHLKVFDSVGRLHGVRRASDECHLSQPAVTQAVAKLEEQIGVTLLERRASGSYLNEFGIIFHRRTERLFAQFEQALLELGVPGRDIPVARIAGRISKSQIRSLISIVENGTFAKAARALGVSQTSLQRAARDLERNLRTPLYAQTASGIVATPAAAEFARKVKLALREIQWGIDEVEAARGNIGGEIVIGAMLLAGSVVLASVINELVSAYPNVNVRILNGNADDMLRYLRTGDVDVVIGLLREPAPDEFVRVALAETPYVVVARHGHPLNQKTEVTLDDLADYDWIIGTPGASRRNRFDKLFAGRRRPQTRIATCSLPTIRLLLSQSDRLTLLTSYELMYEEDALAAVPFGPIEPVPCIGLMTRENWLPTQLQADFIDLVHKQIVASLMPTKVLKRNSGAASQKRDVPLAVVK
jgi:LysR family transcriptional regulator of gallate degradation